MNYSPPIHPPFKMNDVPLTAASTYDPNKRQKKTHVVPPETALIIDSFPASILLPRPPTTNTTQSSSPRTNTTQSSSPRPTDPPILHRPDYRGAAYFRWFGNVRYWSSHPSFNSNVPYTDAMRAEHLKTFNRNNKLRQPDPSRTTTAVESGRLNNSCNTQATPTKPWTDEEDRTLIKMRATPGIGNRWARIARDLPGRTGEEVGQRFYGTWQTMRWCGH